MSDSCGGQGVSLDDYNLPLHVGALFIILGVSSLACAFPLLAIRYPVLHIPSIVLFIARHFGTGVLIATAFVHLLPTAFLSLSNPCLQKFWLEDYPAMPGAIAMAAVFFVAVAEMVFSRRQGLCGGPRDLPTRINDVEHVAQEQHQEDNKIEMTRQRALLQCVLLEMGILFHSVFIGMALSVIVGQDFIILLIAIAFHQTFEGLALGSRIAVIDFKDQPWRPWIMVLAYGCTTPIGQAIGLATHTMYSPDSQVGLLMVGIMNAISSGLLIFASLVELLAEDFLSESSYKTLGGQRKTWSACLLVFLGAFCMSVVGAWA